MIEFYGGYQVYSESGIDLTLLRENLRRSLEERWENNRGVADFAHALGQAGRAHRGLPAQPEQEAVFDPVGILRQLVRHHVAFVVIGGLAMTTHGSAYVTRDLDVCYRRSAQNIAALTAALAPLHPAPRGTPAGLPFRLDADTIQAGLNFALTTERGDLDLRGAVSGVGDPEQVFAHSEEHLLFGLKVHVLSLDALIASKNAVGRRGDQLHLLELEELKRLMETPPEG